MALTVDQWAKMYRIPLVHYGSLGRRGVLLGSGAGLMMGIMDTLPARWCLDLDVLGQNPAESIIYRIEQFVIGAHAVEGVALAGWFSISNPDPIRRIFANLQPPGVVYAGNVRLGVPGEVDCLDDFMANATELFGLPFIPRF